MSLRTFMRNWAVGSAAIVAVSVALQSTAGAGPSHSPRQDAGPVPGSQGTDTSLPLTDSAVTVQGRGRFADLEITVNQTANLTNQAVSLTWKGATPTNFAGPRFFGDYLQIMQCWGDPVTAEDGSVGPPPEQCVQGAAMGAYSPPDSPVNRAATQRKLALAGWDTFDPSIGHVDGGVLWMPFRAVDGTVVNVQENAAYNPTRPGADYWLNPYFNMVTTNEIAAAASLPDGRGSELFQVLTGVESSGLGCGRRSQPASDGSLSVPQCWIVVVPRGTPTEENAGTPFADRAEEQGVQTSPLAPTAWQNRIAVPIDFNPVDSPCSLGNGERRIIGSELALTAVANWQPALCAGGARPPFAYGPVADSTARMQLTNPQAGSPGMVVVSDPVDPAAIDPRDPVLYAPISVSGLTIGFNLERRPHFSAPEAEHLLAGVRVAELNLTPRLVAKLLTQSYKSQLSFSGAMPDLTSPAYEWLSTNPLHLAADPDFVQFNPEFAMLDVGDARTFGGLQLPAGNSDATRRLWEWVLSDPEARDWLGGEPDEWGTRANPLYHTLVESKAAPSSFAKADPYCYQPPPLQGTTILPPPACAFEMIPYASGVRESAIRARTGYDGARVAGDPTALDAQSYWKRVDPQRIGARSMLALTDTPSATRYGIQMARLSRAGDNAPDREFIAPTTRAMTSAVAAMEPGDEPQVLAPADTLPADAYPLTIVSYAAIAPLRLDQPARDDYAAFLEYASVQGQEPGLELGQLPAGYATLPPELKLQSVVAALLVRELVVVDVPTTTTTTTAVPTTTTLPTTSTAPPPTRAPGTTWPTTTATPAPTPPATPPPSPGGGNPPQQPAGVPPATPPRQAAASTTSTTVAATTTSTTSTVPPGSSPAAPPATEPPQVGEEPTPEPEVPPVLTPLMNLSASRMAVPGLGVIGLGAALGALEITKRPRRSSVLGTELP